MQKRNKIIILSLLTLTIISILIISQPIEKQKIPTRLIVAEHPGFDLGPGNINIGQISPGGSARRNITIENTQIFPTITTIRSSGETSKFIIVSENNFMLQPNESTNIMITGHAPSDTPYGDYRGDIIIITNKA
jgi:hypothetical protein